MTTTSQEDRSAFGRAAGIARQWWRVLQPDAERARPQDRSGDRAALARLRRAATLAEAVAEEATLDLWRRLGLKDPTRLPRVAAIAHVLAQVRQDGDRPVMRVVGRETFANEDSARLKPIRFRRLLAAREDEELMREMRRLVQIAERGLDVGHLAASMLYWNDATRARWTFDYFAAGHAAPDAEPVEASA